MPAKRAARDGRVDARQYQCDGGRGAEAAEARRAWPGGQGLVDSGLDPNRGGQGGPRADFADFDRGPISRGGTERGRGGGTCHHGAACSLTTTLSVRRNGRKASRSFVFSTPEKPLRMVLSKLF